MGGRLGTSARHYACSCSHMRRICEVYACCTRRICPQCLLLTAEFNQHQSRERLATLERHLDDMLRLPDAQRQEHSFLCQSADLMHGPLAMAVVDPAVVDLDFNNAPPDRFHGIVDMIDDLLKVVRGDMKKKKLGEVCPGSPPSAALTATMCHRC